MDKNTKGAGEQDLGSHELAPRVSARSLGGPDQDICVHGVPTPTVLSELCGANEGGNLEAVLCAVLAGCEDG